MTKKEIKRLRIVDTSPELEASFATASFAVVGDGTKFVPLIPRHLDDGLLRELYHEGVKRLVMSGHPFKDLCDTCANALRCLQQGMDTDPKFKCTATRKSVGLEKAHVRTPE